MYKLDIYIHFSFDWKLEVRLGKNGGLTGDFTSLKQGLNLT